VTLPPDWKGVRSLFHRALQVPMDERLAFVRRETSADEATCAQVESLLAAHQEAEGFLSDPAVSLVSDDPRNAAARFAAGTRLGVFELLGLVAAGGMGEVYRARDTRLDREVAIKVVARELAADPVSRDRFEREARAVSRLMHPHICTVYDVGSATVDGVDAQFLVMELIDGETLASRLHRGALPLAQARQIAFEILDALSTAHEAGIIHRDLKPANVMLTRSGVKLLDFGLARQRAPSRTSDHSLAARGDDPLTAPGLVLGTLPYMSPEQVRGGEADARSDLFAFGAVLYEMLTGRRAFIASSEPALIAAILEQESTPLGSDASLAPLDSLVRGCLAKAPAERWQHARDVALALRALADDSGRSSPPASAGTTSAQARLTSRAWRVHTTWAAIAALLTAAVWLRGSVPTDAGPPANPQPVIVLMDSPLEGRVYDPRTLAAGGTNADDITDALHGLPLVIHKENASPMWHREEQVLYQNPDLIISHLSALYDQRVTTDAVLRRELFDIAQSRLVAFFGHVAAVNPRTRFLVYSRGRFGAPEQIWTDDVVARFPQLMGRVFTLTVPGGEKATWRDPAIMKELRLRVEDILVLSDHRR
jgi:serine/threonine protein kinase